MLFVPVNSQMGEHAKEEEQLKLWILKIGWNPSLHVLEKRYKLSVQYMYIKLSLSIRNTFPWIYLLIQSTSSLESNLEGLANVLEADLPNYKERILKIICTW